MMESVDSREQCLAAVWQKRPVEHRRLHFVMESRIIATCDEVFAFHESPQALSQLIPPWERVRVASSDGSLHRGSQVILTGSLLGIPLRWVAIHFEYEPPHLFSDIQASGPFAWWYHRHHILHASDRESILRDEVEYTLPLGTLGRIVGGRMIRKKLQRMFEYRHRKTAEICTAVGGSVPAQYRDH